MWGSPLIPSLAAFFCTAAVAQDAPAEPPAQEEEAEVEDPISRYRVPFRVLTNRTIGTSSVPVAFDWRRTRVHVAARGGFLFELNTFNSASAGGMVRFPGPRTLVELSVGYVEVWDSESSEALAFTAFRQPGRPDRLEVEAVVAVPLAEGVVTAVPRFFPATQLVFSATLGVRYSIYPRGFANLRPGQVATALFSPTLQPEEVANLEAVRLDAMSVDPGRYGLLAGFSNDLYFERGVFVSPRVQFALPVLALVNESGLPFWIDASLVVGVAL